MRIILYLKRWLMKFLPVSKKKPLNFDALLKEVISVSVREGYKTGYQIGKEVGDDMIHRVRLQLEILNEK